MRLSGFDPLRLAAHAGTALALGLAGVCVQAQKAPDAPASAASAPAEGARPDVAVLLDAARAMVQANQYTEALAKLKEVEAKPDLSPYETYFLDRLRGAAALGAGDAALASKSIDASIASGRLKDADARESLKALSDLYFRNKDYPHSIETARRYFKAGGDEPVLRIELVNAMYASGDYAGAIPELQSQVKADQAAGRATSEQVLRMLASSQVKAKDDAGYAQTLELLVARYPKPDLWGDLIYRATDKPGFSDNLRLDMYRLRVATGSMTQTGEYMEMAQLALKAGYPGEASRVLDDGFSRGLLGTGANAKTQTQLRDQARKQAASDATSLAQPMGNRDGNALVAAGFALTTSGQADKGLALMQQGLAKGGVKQPEEARLHLGIAQWMAGQKEAAVQTFKTVQGADGAADLARLWGLLAQMPATPAAKSAAG